MTFVRFLNVATQITPAPTTGATSKQVLLIGQRVTGGKLILANNGYPQPNLYIPMQLPSFSNGTSGTNYLSNYGIISSLGIGFSLDLPAPSTVTVTGSNTTLTWVTPPYGFTQLTGFALAGILTQGLVTGTVLSATLPSGVATMIIQGSPAFNTTDPMTLSGLNNVAYPDPNLTDPIALMTWDFYQSALSASPPTQGFPSAYVSIVSDRDSSCTPDPTPFTIPEPTSVTVNPDTSVTLSYTYVTADILPVPNTTDNILGLTGKTYISTLTNFGYLPTTEFGATTLTQNTSNATGTFGGYAIYPDSTGGTVQITVTNVTGTFNDTDTLDVVLDDTINVFNFLNNVNLYAGVLQFPIDNLADVTTTYADFYDGITALNEPDQVLNNHYFTYGIAGNITSLPNAASSLPVVNNQEDILVSYPYVAQFGNIPYDNTAGTVASGRISAAVAYMLANGDTPYPSLGGSTINHLPVSSIANTTSYSFTVGGTGDLAITQGWLPLAPNSGNIVTFIQSNTTLTTIPGTSVPDQEFRYTHVWDSVRWLRQQVSNLFQSISVLPNNAGQAFISPAFVRQFRGGIIGILNYGQSLGIFQNVSQYQNLVTVTQDTQNPNQVDAYVPCQIIPQLNGGNVTINVFSSLYQFSTNQGAL